jgi:leucyl/phenylalanyl-tRNA--protein transferase
MVFGESMFTRQSDASKIALAALVAFCKAKRISMIDCQQNTQHLSSFGAKEIPRANFADHVREQTGQPAPEWIFNTLYWDEILQP